MSSQIVRLDYTQPPPGTDAVGWSVRGVHSRDAAWTRYKEHHDPPGLAVMSFRACALGLPDPEARAAAWAWYDERLELANQVETCNGAVRPELAAKYWALYGVTLPLWPRALGWSPEAVAGLKRWLINSTAELPEVLRG